MNKIIVALDYRSREDALRMVTNLSGLISFYKIGLELYLSAGPEIVLNLKNKGLKVFLDLKFFDIPNTMAKAARAGVSLGVDMFNLHLLAGKEALIAAREAAREEAAQKNQPAPKILGVTVLTSSSGEEWREIGVSGSVPELVIRLTERAKKAGLDGVVASALDAAAIKKRFGQDFLVVSPGIRLRSQNVGARFIEPERCSGRINPTPTNAVEGKGEGDDQRRTLSAKEAFAAGSDYIVVGRPITGSPDPKKACLELLT